MLAVPHRATSRRSARSPRQGSVAAAGNGIAAAYSRADILITLAVLDPGVGADHLSTWASEAVAVVTAGASTTVKIHATGEMIRGGQHTSCVCGSAGGGQLRREPWRGRLTSSTVGTLRARPLGAGRLTRTDYDDRRLQRRVVATWALLLLNVMPYSKVGSILPIPNAIGKVRGQAALPLALLLALSVNRRLNFARASSSAWRACWRLRPS